MIIFIVVHAHEENSILTQSRVNLVFFERKIFIRKLFRVQLRELRELGLLGRIDENHFRTRIPRNFLRFNAVYRRMPRLMLLHERPRPVVPNDQDAIVAVGELRDWLAEDTSARPSPLRRKRKFRRDFGPEFREVPNQRNLAAAGRSYGRKSPGRALAKSRTIYGAEGPFSSEIQRSFYYTSPQSHQSAPHYLGGACALRAPSRSSNKRPKCVELTD